MDKYCNNGIAPEQGDIVRCAGVNYIFDKNYHRQSESDDKYSLCPENGEGDALTLNSLENCIIVDKRDVTYRIGNPDKQEYVLREGDDTLYRIFDIFTKEWVAIAKNYKSPLRLARVSELTFVKDVYTTPDMLINDNSLFQRYIGNKWTLLNTTFKNTEDYDPENLEKALNVIIAKFPRPIETKNLEVLLTYVIVRLLFTASCYKRGVVPYTVIDMSAFLKECTFAKIVTTILAQSFLDSSEYAPLVNRRTFPEIYHDGSTIFKITKDFKYEIYPR